MNPKPFALVSGVAVAVSVAFLAGFAVGQAKPPTESKGISTVGLRSLDLTHELESTKGRNLRMRKVTLQPGGVIRLHNHVDRPAITYMLEGSVTYHQEGKPDRVLKPGDGLADGKASTHWGENTGKVPAVWISVDIPK